MALATLTSPKLKEFFLGLTRSSFGQLAIGDQQIVDYVASMLAEFARSDQWLALGDAEGRLLTSVVEMLVMRPATDARERVVSERRLRKYVGDYTLFMSGLFRRHVEHGGYLDYYLKEGKRSYQAVSSLDLSLYQPGFLMFEELSQRFEIYAGGLDFMRKCYFASASGENPFKGFFEQIKGWAANDLSVN